MAKSLLDILCEADALQLDNFFIRHFHIEYEECESDDDPVLTIEVDLTYEFFFTTEELNTAKKLVGDGWVVQQGTKLFTIIPYKLTEIKS